MQDLSFIPEYRNDPGVTGTQANCASWTWWRDALLTVTRPRRWQGWPAQFESVRPWHYGGCFQSDELKLIAETEVGQTADQSTFSSDDIADARQNLLRWAGDLPAAKRSAEQWQSATGRQERAARASAG